MNIGAMSFEGSIWLMIAILLGIVAAVITYINSRKLKGEVFEKPFIYFALGIFFATFSLIDVTFLQGVFSDGLVSLLHDLSFIAGLALMLLASIRITKYLQGIEKFTKKIK